MKRTIIARSAKDLGLIPESAFNDGPLEVRISPYKGKRTLLQNSLSFALYPQVNDIHGETGDWARGFCKYHFGFSVIAQKSCDYVARVRQMLEGLEYERRILICSSLPCTSMMNVKEMTEYIDQVVMYHAQQGYIIEIKANGEYDSYREAGDNQ